MRVLFGVRRRFRTGVSIIRVLFSVRRRSSIISYTMLVYEALL